MDDLKRLLREGIVIRSLPPLYQLRLLAMLQAHSESTSLLWCYTLTVMHKLHRLLRETECLFTEGVIQGASLRTPGHMKRCSIFSTYTLFN